MGSASPRRSPPAGSGAPEAGAEAHAESAAGYYLLGPYRLDARARILLRDGDAVPLGERAVSVLLLLVEQAGRVVCKDQLIDIVWNGLAVEESNLTVQIAALRRELAAIPGGRSWIETLPRRGYRFVGPVTVSSPPAAGRAAADAARPADDAALPPPIARPPSTPPPGTLAAGRRRGPLALAAFAALAALALLVLGAAPRIFAMDKPVLAVLPFKTLGAGPAADAMALAVTERLADGMSAIRAIRTVETRWNVTASPDAGGIKAIAEESGARFIVAGTLLSEAGNWEIEARLIDTRDGNTAWAGGFTVAGEDANPARTMKQLVGLIGDPIAVRISGILNRDEETGPAAEAVQSLISQARQFTDQNARDRSLAAEELFQRALALDPASAAARVHLARTRISAFVNGWYGAAEGATKMADAAEMLHAVLKAKPTYLPALDANCLYMRAADRFLDGLPACDAVLAIDPWSVRAIKEMGLDQMILGRFEEALVSFAKADRLDATHGIRWAWLEGAGLVSLLLDRNDEAVSWLNRSIAAAPGTGRSFALLAAAYERLGRHDEASAALEKFRARQPEASLRSMFPPDRKGNPRYVEAMQRLRPALAQTGLP